MPNRITDDEYERLIAQDNAEESGDPWHRTGAYGEEESHSNGFEFEPGKPAWRRPLETGIGLQQSK